MGPETAPRAPYVPLGTGEVFLFDCPQPPSPYDPVLWEAQCALQKHYNHWGPLLPLRRTKAWATQEASSMGSSSSTAKAGTCLDCILRNWDSFDLKTLKKKRLVFFCTQAWPQYKLADGEAWPPEGSLNYNTILQLDLFCRREGKWLEVPYVRAFFALRDNQKLRQQCRVNSLLLVASTPEGPRGSPQGSPAPLSPPRPGPPEAIKAGPDPSSPQGSPGPSEAIKAGPDPSSPQGSPGPSEAIKAGLDPSSPQGSSGPPEVIKAGPDTSSPQGSSGPSEAIKAGPDPSSPQGSPGPSEAIKAGLDPSSPQGSSGPPEVIKAGPDPSSPQGSSGPPEAIKAGPDPSSPQGSPGPPEVIKAGPDPSSPQGSPGPPEAIKAGPDPSSPQGSSGPPEAIKAGRDPSSPQGSPGPPEAIKAGPDPSSPQGSPGPSEAIKAGRDPSSPQSSPEPFSPPCPGPLESVALPEAINTGVNGAPATLFPLQVVAGGELGPTRVQVPFPLEDLWKTILDLGTFSDDPDKYIEKFEGLTRTFDLSWGDVMLLLTQTLSEAEKQAVLKAAQQCGDECLLSPSSGARGQEGEHVPSGLLAVPLEDPKWDPSDPLGCWRQKHFQACVVQGLRRAKPDYSKLSSITQGKDEKPAAFLARLLGALREHTFMSLDSREGQLFLKERLLTQSAPDIRSKLELLARAPESTLDDFLILANWVFYSRDRAEAKDRKARRRKKASVVPQGPRGRGVPAATCYCCGQPGHFQRDCPRGKRRPPWPCPLCKGNHWKSDCPSGRRPPRAPAQTAISTRKPRVTLTVEGREIGFLLDTGASFSVLHSNPGLPSSRSVALRGVSGKLVMRHFSQPLSCQWDSLFFSHAFLIVPESQTPVLGGDIFTCLSAAMCMVPGRVIVAPLVETEIDPELGATQGRVGRVAGATPARIRLRDAASLPCQKQYVLQPEVRQGLQALVDNLKARGLVIPCRSPCNTPILGLRKPSGEWRLVQDLRLINEIVVPEQPADVPSTYALLSQVPEDATWFTVLDLKDASFCIPLHPDSQFLFAFQDPSDPSTQLTWTVLPQGFRDTPHLLSRALDRDLRQFDHPQTTVLRYVDDLLLCAPSEEVCRKGTSALLNFLAGRGYEVSMPKAQLCQTSVTYLGLVLTKGTVALRVDRVKHISSLPLPRTRKDLQSFLGVTSSCRLWVPAYGEIARPLHQMVKKAQREKLTWLAWEPTAELAFEKLKQALLQAPTLSLPTGQDFRLYVTERGGVALGVLAQPRGPEERPVGYLSKELNGTAKRWPAGPRAVAAVALLVPEATKLTLGRDLAVFNPHNVAALLALKRGPWCSDSHFLKCRALLLEQPAVQIRTCPTLHLATLLPEEQEEVSRD